MFVLAFLTWMLNVNQKCDVTFVKINKTKRNDHSDNSVDLPLDYRFLSLSTNLQNVCDTSVVRSIKGKPNVF